MLLDERGPRDALGLALLGLFKSESERHLQLFCLFAILFDLRMQLFRCADQFEHRALIDGNRAFAGHDHAPAFIRLA